LIQENSAQTGVPVATIPDTWIAAALQALEAAAEQGLPLEEQALLGLASIAESGRSAMSAMANQA
jgi:hypothetical protein